MFATLVSYGIRAWTWHKYRVYIDIEALQLSLLAGRVFFKGVKYHGDNQTMLIHSGYITWNYWLRNVREVDIKQARPLCASTSKGTTDNDSHINRHDAVDAETAGVVDNTNLSCRITMALQGVEWFVYNNSITYDAILARVASQDQSHVGQGAQQAPRQKSSHQDLSMDDEKSTETSTLPVQQFKADLTSSAKDEKDINKLEPSSNRSTSSIASEDSPDRDQPVIDTSLPFFLRCLPVHISCNKAAIVVGNNNTKSVLILKADKSFGDISATASRPADQYRQLIDFRFEQPVVQIKPNDDYKEDQKTTATRVKHNPDEAEGSSTVHAHYQSYFQRQRHRSKHALYAMLPFLRRSVESFSSGLDRPQVSNSNGISDDARWQGLSRYLDDTQQHTARWSSVEYGMVTTLLDSPESSLSFYWDVGGPVCPSESSRGDNPNINGCQPPGYGINIKIKNAVLNYGPWADRQRANLQAVFFPALCQDSSAVADLTIGDTRVATQFKLNVKFEGETKLRMPCRENSKNWKWAEKRDPVIDRQLKQKSKGSRAWKAKVEKKPAVAEARPFGWLDIRVPEHASVAYTMDMVAGTNGFLNLLELDLPDGEITTSVNHGLLWRSKKNQLACDLSFPLGWNSLRHWTFDFSTTGLELFILREHIFLLTDLSDDWASGPPPEYLAFTPFNYVLNVHLEDFKLYLNVNDANIINQPADFDDNTFIVLFGSVLDASVAIPMTEYRPQKSDITFDVSTRHAGLKLHVPPWNTHAAFMYQRDVAQIKSIRAKGTYQFYTTNSSANTDTLILDIHGHAPTCQLYGFIIRYFIKITDNYFGSDIRFKTLEEYQKNLRIKDRTKPLGPVANDLDVILSISSDEATAILPANLYSATNNVCIDIPSLAADLRITNYYMELELFLHTLAFSHGHQHEDGQSAQSTGSRTQLHIDGINVSGSRLFGMPPDEPTYVCNWDFCVGAINGECSAQLIKDLIQGGKAFAFSLDDDENTLPVALAELPHDVTFLRAEVDSVRIWLHSDDFAFLLSTGTMDVTSSDWARSQYSARVFVDIPDIQFACINTESISRHRKRPDRAVDTYALLRTHLKISIVHQKLNFAEDKQLQQDHILFHDRRTNRTKFLLMPEQSDAITDVVDAPTVPVAPMPSPLPRKSIEADYRTDASSHTTGRSTSRKSSFLSTPSKAKELGMSSHSASRQFSRGLISRVQGEASNSNLGSHATGSHKAHCAHTMQAASSQDTPNDETLRGFKTHRSDTIAMSSPYAVPYFPLEDVEPDEVDLPPMETYTYADLDGGHDQIYQDSVLPRAEDTTEHTRILIGFDKGISCVMKPTFFQALSLLVLKLEASAPNDILDLLQCNMMGSILRTHRKMLQKAETIDISIHSPHTYLRLLNPVPQVTTTALNQDQYNCRITNLGLLARKSSKMGKEPNDILHSSYAFHLSLVLFTLSAAEQCFGDIHSEPAISFDLHDPVVWLTSDRHAIASMKLRAFILHSASGHLEYLAALLYRTNLLLGELQKVIEPHQNQQSDRFKVLIYLIASSAKSAADPLFLTRPSYVLRSTPHHLRSYDSWRLLTRLRFLFEGLEPAVQENATMQCMRDGLLIPTDLQAKTEGAFEKLHNWDWEILKSSLLWKHIYPSKSCSSTNDTNQTASINLSVVVGLLRLVIDPGPRQNEIVFNDLSLGCQSCLRTDSRHQLATRQDCAMWKIIAEISCSRAKIIITWELCELVEGVIKLARSSRDDLDITSIKPADLPAIDQVQHELHVVAHIGNGSMVIDTINITSISTVYNLKGTLIVAPTRAKHPDASLLIMADSVTSDMRSRTQDIATTRFACPIIYVCCRSLAAKDPFDDVQVAGKCQEIQFSVQQEISGLVEVIDAMLVDELPQLLALTQRLSSCSSPLEPSLIDENPRFKVHLALFLGMYHIRLPLLHSLVYGLSGSIATASLDVDHNFSLVFDFDIAEHVHELSTVMDRGTIDISSFVIAPTNGRLKNRAMHNRSIVSIYASSEPIKLDATSIHSLLVTLSRPELSVVFADLKTDISNTQSKFKEVWKSQGTETSVQQQAGLQQRRLVYDVHCTLAGLSVIASTHPENPIQQASKHLVLNFGSMNYIIANHHDDDESIATFPRLHGSLSSIVFELSSVKADHLTPCGSLSLGVLITMDSKSDASGNEIRAIGAKGEHLRINMVEDTAVSVVEIMVHLQHKIEEIDFSREKRYLRKLRGPKPVKQTETQAGSTDSSLPTAIFTSMYSLELLDNRVTYSVRPREPSNRLKQEPENLVLSLRRLDLSTRRENSARLTIEELQLQMIPGSQDQGKRSANSALLPEVVFNVGYISTKSARRLAFQAAGKSLDLRLDSRFILPAAEIQNSIQSSLRQVREASAAWTPKSGTDASSGGRKKPLFGTKRMESLLVDADFAGAVVFLSGKRSPFDPRGMSQGSAKQPSSRYNVSNEAELCGDTILRAPGLAWKIEYKDNGLDDPSLNAEVKVDASSNTLYPAVVTSILEMSSAIKEIVKDDTTGSRENISEEKKITTLISEEDKILITDPSAVLGRTRLNLGVRICKQEFSLSCQPIARVSATARFADIYMTVNTVRSNELGNFFAASAKFTKLQASVQHVYSRESTGTFEVESIFLSLMNSKHFSGNSGLSAILKVSPMNVSLNVKQLQDFLLFREIWVPVELRGAEPAPTPTFQSTTSQNILMQRYQQVAATGAFPWNATISISVLDVQLDLGQAIGKMTLDISEFWILSKKTSDWEQNLCLGFKRIEVSSVGRMSGFVNLEDFRVRTMIEWPSRQKALNQTPLVQGSIAFNQLRAKAAFDYQAFLVANITRFNFVMHNVRNGTHAKGDRLVAIIDGESVQVFCTATTASQALALYQALTRLALEKRANYEASLKEIVRFMRRSSTAVAALSPSKSTTSEADADVKKDKGPPVSLHTDVIVTLKAINIGAFPSTFLDHQVFKLEALNAQARFATMIEKGTIHSILGLTLGQLRIGLAGVKEPGDLSQPANEISVDDVVASASGSRGGTILKVPKVSATMQTWQQPNTTQIDYLFRSAFEGKVEVGWNYSRISFIRSMWASHSKALAQRLGKPVSTTSALKITGVPGEYSPGLDRESQKITAEVNVPQSKYNYTALQPPIIETPQLRDMGEATPPLEVRVTFLLTLMNHADL